MAIARDHICPLGAPHYRGRERMALRTVSRGTYTHMAIREDMVKRAVGFLRHPKVTGAPQEKQTRFLKDKKLTSLVSTK